MREGLSIEEFRSRKEMASMPSASKTESSRKHDPRLGDRPPLPVARANGGIRGRQYETDSLSSPALEARTQKIGRELFERIGRGPRPWQRAWWEERFIAATLDDALVRVQLFRFIDALPALKTTDSVRRHLAEYSGRGR